MILMILKILKIIIKIKIKVEIFLTKNLIDIWNNINFVLRKKLKNNNNNNLKLNANLRRLSDFSNIYKNKTVDNI